MKKTEFKLPENGRELYGVMIEPEGEGKFPTIIFSHGYNGSGRDFDSEQKDISCIRRAVFLHEPEHAVQILLLRKNGHVRGCHTAAGIHGTSAEIITECRHSMPRQMLPQPLKIPSRTIVAVAENVRKNGYPAQCFPSSKK